MMQKAQFIKAKMIPLDLISLRNYLVWQIGQATWGKDMNVHFSEEATDMAKKHRKWY